MEGEGQKPETWSDYGYYGHGVMTHGMLSRWDNYVTMNDHDGWCMVNGQCTLGIIQNIGSQGWRGDQGYKSWTSMSWD